MTETTEGHEETGGDQGTSTRRSSGTPPDPARLLRRSARRREKIPTAGGSTLHLLVLSSTIEDTTVVDLATSPPQIVRAGRVAGRDDRAGSPGREAARCTHGCGAERAAFT